MPLMLKVLLKTENLIFSNIKNFALKEICTMEGSILELALNSFDLPCIYGDIIIFFFKDVP